MNDVAEKKDEQEAANNQLDEKSSIEKMQHQLAKIQAASTYVTELRQKIGLYTGWIPNEYADQAAADSGYSILKQDSEVKRCLHAHSLMCAGEKVRVICEDEKLKTIVERLLARVQDFIHARKSLIENGMLFGLGVQRKYYRNTVIKEFPDYDWICVSEINEVDTRRLRIERDTEFRDVVYWTMYNPVPDQYIKILDRNEYPEQMEGDAIQDYVWYFHEEEELNPYFAGLGQVLYPIVYAKSLVFQYWRELCESWAKPWLVASMDMLKGSISAALGADFKTAAERITAWLDVMEKARARHGIVMDKNDKLEVVEHGSTGNNICAEFMKYADEKIALAILGAELTTSTGGGAGSFALGSIHRQLTETLVMYSRARLEEVITRDIVFDLLYRNRMNLYALGLDAPEYGDVKIEFYIPAEVQKEQAVQQQISNYKGDMNKFL